jgi:DNA-binding HxlR family transcriptional regulator
MNTTARAKAIPPIFVGKWTTNILFALNERAYRHGQLKRRLGGVSQRMLTRTLRNLESATHREKVVGIGPARRPLFLDRTGARIHSTADQHVQLGEAAR